MKVGFSIDCSIDASQEVGLEKPIKIFKRIDMKSYFLYPNLELLILEKYNL